MDGFIDSDYTMIASQIFDKILNSIRDSGLNFSLQMSPFAATISLKKSLVKDKFGRFIIPSQSFSSSSDVVASLLKKNGDLEKKLEILERSLASQQQELDSAHSDIRMLTSMYQSEVNLDQFKDKSIQQCSAPKDQDDILNFTCTDKLSL